MFFSVIVGYVLSAMFAFAGALQIVSYLKGVDQSLGYRPFIDGLAQSCWYLAVAVGLVLLIQIATFLERLVMENKKQPLLDFSADSVSGRPSLASEGASAELAAGDASVSGSGVTPSPVSSVKEMETPHEAFSVSASAPADPEAPRVPDLPGSRAASLAEEPSETEGESRLNYFKM